MCEDEVFIFLFHLKKNYDQLSSKLTTFSLERSHVIGEEAQCVNMERKCMGAPAWVSTALSEHVLTVLGPFLWILNVTKKGFKRGLGINVSDREGKAAPILMIKYCSLGSVTSV